MSKERPAPREEVRINRHILTTDNTALNESDVMPRAESDGTLKVSLETKDAAGNLESPLVDTNDVLWTREFHGVVALVGVAVPAVEGILLDGSASLSGTGTDVYHVWFNVINVDGTNSVTVDVGRDDAAGGSLAAGEYWMKSRVVPAGGETGWNERPFTMFGDDDVRGVAGAASDAVIQFDVRRVDLSA